MNVTHLPLDGAVLFEGAVFADGRGSFRELWRHSGYRAAGIAEEFVQDNVSISRRGVVRGMHYQWPAPQGKLVTVLLGAAYDVLVDVRVGSPTFGRWLGFELSAANARQLYIPPGFAHGFQTLEDQTVVAYKCTAYYDRASDSAILWNDPALAIDWPLADAVVSQKDAAAPLLADVAAGRLPVYAAPIADAR